MNSDRKIIERVDGDDTYYSLTGTKHEIKTTIYRKNVTDPKSGTTGDIYIIEHSSFIYDALRIINTLYKINGECELVINDTDPKIMRDAKKIVRQLINDK